MSTELTNTSKLREFVEELKYLKIEIIKPSINKCFSDFRAINGQLYYGLGAIKNVGFEAISNIIKEREINGEFKSFIDFINRVNSKDVNKLQLEGLTKAGVFDEFEADRGKIFNSIPKIIQNIKNINDDKDNNQSSLFGNDENNQEQFDFLPSQKWNQKNLLSEEFKSIGFYLSNHPLNEYEETFNQLGISTYSHFYNNDFNEGLVAGTIMSIQEKKSAKGTPYAIVKFSDKNAEFELFLFAEILVSNRDKLKESESFVLTLQKDKISGDKLKKRINVKKILSLDEVINKPYSNITIELSQDCNLKEIKNLLSSKGETKINFIIKDQHNKQAYYSLQENRKFDLNHFKALKAKKYVEKIIV